MVARGVHRGYVFRSRWGLEAYFSLWYEEIATELRQASYADFTKERRERHPLGREMFGKLMVGLGAKFIRPRNMMVGERLADVEKDFSGTVRKVEPIRFPRPQAYHLGILAHARAAFTTFTGLPVEWPSGMTRAQLPDRWNPRSGWFALLRDGQGRQGKESQKLFQRRNSRANHRWCTATALQKYCQSIAG
jgi:hypothetical protein